MTHLRSPRHASITFGFLALASLSGPALAQPSDEDGAGGATPDAPAPAPDPAPAAAPVAERMESAPAVPPAPESSAARPPTARPEPAPLAPAPRDARYDGPPTLVSGSKASLGGYGGLGAAYTRMLGQDGGLLSLEAALLLDHRLSLGLAGYGFSQTPEGPADAEGTPQRFGAGYGGFAIRYSVFGELPVYGTFGAVIGGGAVALDDWEGGADDDRRRGDWPRDHLDTFFVFQPELTVASNVTRWFRVGITGGYRFASGVERFGLDSSDLSGGLVGGHLQFGWL
jgi:hypothetical protein